MRILRALDIFLIFLIRLSACSNEMIPDRNYKMVLTSANDIIRMRGEALINDFNVRFALFTSENPSRPQFIFDGDVASLQESNFNHRNPTRCGSHSPSKVHVVLGFSIFIITGWLGNSLNSINRQVTRAYLERGSFNVINVDWSEAAVDFNYVAAAAKTPRCGYKLASFIRFLTSMASLDVNTTYLIGHSLGAQVAGFAGKLTGPQKINTIIGLDPAKPLFDPIRSIEHLEKGDALYVETINTDGGVLGEIIPLGDASFYPAYGKSQPGCIDVTTLCDHGRAVQYFVETLEVPNKFYGVQCENFKNIINRKCQRTGVWAYMGGEPSNFGRVAKGVYYMPVNYVSPFGMGEF